MKRYGFLVISTLAWALSSNLAFAQATDEVQDQVQRAVAAAVSSSISDAISQSVTGDAAAKEASSTAFATPSYTRVKFTDTDGAVTNINVYGATAGAFHLFEENLGFHFAVNGSIAEGENDTDASLLLAVVGGDYIFANTKSAKGWIQADATIGVINIDAAEDIVFYTFSPTLFGSFRLGGNILVEPSVGISVAGSDATDGSFWAGNVGGKLKYRGEQFRPQVAVLYNRSFEDENIATITAGPELNYVIDKKTTLGIGYSYTRLLGSTVDVDVHTGLINFRIIF